jgi:hypothetical protein
MIVDHAVVVETKRRSAFHFTSSANANLFARRRSRVGPHLHFGPEPKFYRQVRF